MYVRRRYIYLTISILIIFIASVLFIHALVKDTTINIQTITQEYSTNIELIEDMQIPEYIDFWTDIPHNILAKELVARMTDEELYAQILMFGWAGKEPSSLVTDWVTKRTLGSVKVFGWNTDNIADVAKSVTLLQEHAQKNRFKIPLFVATDQEGGWIRHIKGTTSDTPGNLAIGASGLPIDAYYSGYYIAKELRLLGINMNFAPTVDLYTDHNSTVIGPRSFGEESHAAGILGASFAAGSIAAGVLPTAKHFPGHGDTGIDSHGGLPVISIDKQTLDTRELVPFRYLIEENIPAIMSGHISFPNITKQGEPASLSSYFLKEILRNELGFKGLIITDDMMMNGATTYTGSFSSAVALAIRAGNDIIISSTTPGLNEAVWKNNLSLMKTDAEFKHAVIDAAHRVILFKLTYLKSESSVPLFPDIETAIASIPDAQSTTFFLEQACRSITLLKEGSFPLNTESKILLAGQYPDFFTSGKNRFKNSESIRFSYLPGPNETSYIAHMISEKAQTYDAIVFCVTNKESFAILEKLKKLKTKIIVISVLSPVFVLNIDWTDTILIAYSYSPFSFKAVFAALAGDFYPEGIFPLTGFNK